MTARERGTRRASPSADSSRRAVAGHAWAPSRRRRSRTGRRRHQRDDREHLRTGTELEDREKVGQVIAQDIAGDTDRVLPGAGAREGEARRSRDVEDLDLKAIGVELRRGPRAPCAGPARRARGSRRARTPPAHRRAGPLDGQPHPVTNGSVRGLAHAPDVARVDRRARAALCRRRRPPAPCPGAAISKVLSCEPYSSAACAIRPTFGSCPSSPGRTPVLAAVAPRSRRTAPRRSDRGSRTWCPAARPRVPHLPGSADRRGHRRVDDHVAGDVEVGDAAIGVDHRERRPVAYAASIAAWTAARSSGSASIALSSAPSRRSR